MRWSVIKSALPRLLAVFAILASMLVVESAPAKASDCWGGVCGTAQNYSSIQLVAASYDKYGGICSPWTDTAGHHCGTCGIASGSNSSVCSSIFSDVDAVTFQYYSWKVYNIQGQLLVWLQANQYYQFHSYSTAQCGGSPSSGLYCTVF